MYAIIRSCGIEHPDIVLRQYQIESAHGKSRLAIEQFNLFGMSCVSNRPTKQTGCKNGYGVYCSILDSVLDYKLWQARYSGLSRAEYLIMLRKIYIKDKKYLREWFK